MSPKNKGKFGKAKATKVATTDEFISIIDRVVSAVRPHASRLAVFLGVIAIIVVGYATWDWWHDRKLMNATELYMRAVSLSQVPVHPPDKKDDKAKASQPDRSDRSERPPDPRNLPAEFASAEERARAVLSALEELSSRYESTSIGHQGLLLQAEALYELGRYGEAADRYRQFADGGGPDELVLAAREGLGYALEAQAMAEKDAKARQAGLEKSLQAFQEMQPRADGPRHDEALYHQARVQTELGRKDQARKTFEQILTDHPDSTLKQDIDMRLPALRAAK